MSAASFFSKALCGTILFQKEDLQKLPIPLEDFSLQTVFRLSTAGYSVPDNTIDESEEEVESAPSPVPQPPQPSWAEVKAAAMTAAFQRCLKSLMALNSGHEDQERLQESIGAVASRLGELVAFAFLQDLMVDCKTPMSNERTARVSESRCCSRSLRARAD
ncbi:unnamed protein product [Effrenium voratum]|nr:unnamed protein product [Effrenium voratum]